MAAGSYGPGWTSESQRTLDVKLLIVQSILETKIALEIRFDAAPKPPLRPVSWFSSCLTKTKDAATASDGRPYLKTLRSRPVRARM